LRCRRLVRSSTCVRGFANCAVLADARSGERKSSGAGGKEIVAAKCADCHAIKVVESAHHSNRDWQAAVAAMIARGARLTPEEIPLVVEYLSAQFGASAEQIGGVANAASSKSGADADFSQAPARATITGNIKTDQGEVRGLRVTSHNLLYKVWYVVFAKDGHYSIPKALPGPYELGVLEEGYDSPTQQITLAPEQTQRVNFEVKRRPPDPTIAYVDYDELYPPGPGRDLLEKNCTGCHGGDFFPMQHRTETGWRAAP
jgi:hypothetical protein